MIAEGDPKAAHPSLWLEPQSPLVKADVPLSPDDHVIRYPYVQQVPRLHNASRDRHIVGAGRAIARRLVVHDDHPHFPGTYRPWHEEEVSKALSTASILVADPSLAKRLFTHRTSAGSSFFRAATVPGGVLHAHRVGNAMAQYSLNYLYSTT